MRSEFILPDIMLITPEPPADAAFDAFLSRFQHALASGIKLVQLRAKTLDANAYVALAGEAAKLCREHGARLILNGPVDDPRVVDADGLHLDSAQLMACEKRTLPPSLLLSAACHSHEQLLQAEHIGADLVTLSPVLPTTSHPGAPVLGWRRFAKLVSDVHVPVYALGGMTRDHSVTARGLGAHGIAAISALW
jgi:thiamine-phosphate pyrophosphorylase